MFCKWCGSPLKPTDAKCPGCKREQPPLSQCGGFYDLAPEARNLLSASGSAPTPQPAPPQEPVPAPRSAFAGLALGVAAALLLVCTVLLVKQNHEINALERENASLQSLLTDTTQPDYTFPTQEPESSETISSGTDTEPSAEPPTETNPGVESSSGELQTDPTEPTDPTELTEPTEPKQQISLAQKHLRMEMIIPVNQDGQEDAPVCRVPYDSINWNCDFSQSESLWVGRYTYLPDGSNADWSAEIKENSVHVNYAIGNKETPEGHESEDTLGDFESSAVIWEYRIDSDAGWTQLPDSLNQVGEKPNISSLELSALQDALGQTEGTIYLRCTFTRENKDGGSITFVVENIPVTLDESEIRIYY